MHCFVFLWSVKEAREINQSDNKAWSQRLEQSGKNCVCDAYENLRQKRIKKRFKRHEIYFLTFTVTSLAVDKVYVDFIVHSFITTELCFWKHYLYICAPTWLFVKCFFSLPFSEPVIYCTSLLNCLCETRFFSAEWHSQKSFSLSEPIRSSWFISMFDLLLHVLNASEGEKVALKHIITGLKWRRISECAKEVNRARSKKYF